MLDRILNRALNLTIVGLVAVAGGVGLGLGYTGLLRLLGGQFTGCVLIVLSVGLITGAYHLCRHRRYLADT